MKKITLLLALSISTILLAQEDSSNKKSIKVPQIAVKLGQLDTIVMDGVQIEFLEVLEDSRCPKNATCIWAGEAKVAVKITSPEGKVTNKTLVFSGTTSPIIGLFNDVKISALRLTPYPDATIAKKDQAPYTLLIQQKHKKTEN